jgi:hypothetical protein
MKSLTMEWDTSQIAALKAQGLERALFRVVSKAGSDAIRAARVTSSRTVRFRKRMKVKRVNEGLVLGFPRGARDLGALTWRVDVSGERFTLSSFPYRQTKRGVVVKVNRGKGVLINGAFEARMKSGHIGVFVRERTTGAPKKKKRGKYASPPRVGRLKIEELFTTRIPDVFADAGMVPAVHARAQNVFSATFSRLLPLELLKAGAK